MGYRESLGFTGGQALRCGGPWRHDVNLCGPPRLGRWERWAGALRVAVGVGLGENPVMGITLKPEVEELIRQDVERGGYRTATEFVEHAVTLLDENPAWLSEHRAEITAKVDKGYASAQLGELVDEAEVRSEMQERKRVWLAENRRA